MKNKQTNIFDNISEKEIFELSGNIRTILNLPLVNEEDLEIDSVWYYNNSGIWESLTVTGVRSKVVFYVKNEKSLIQKEEHADIESWFIKNLEPSDFYTTKNPEYVEIVSESNLTKIHYISRDEMDFKIRELEDKKDSKTMTYSGNNFDVFNPNYNLINLTDIIQALSKKCRFGGHSKIFYSVLEHSIRCYKIAKEKSPVNYHFQLATLFHDTTEAYLPDMLTPIKRQMPDFKKLEQTIEDAIGLRFKIDFKFYKKEIKKIDNQAFQEEWKNVMINDNFIEQRMQSVRTEFSEIYEELSEKISKEISISEWNNKKFQAQIALRP